MVEDVRSIADPLARAKRAQQLQRDAATAESSLAAIRAQAVRELREMGWSHGRIAMELEIARGTAQSIAEGRSLAKDDEGPDAD